MARSLRHGCAVRAKEVRDPQRRQASCKRKGGLNVDGLRVDAPQRVGASSLPIAVVLRRALGRALSPKRGDALRSVHRSCRFGGGLLSRWIGGGHPPSPTSPSQDGQRRKLGPRPEWIPDPETTPPTLTAIRSRLNNTYTGYSIGCAVVWAALLATGRGLLEAKNWERLRLGAAGWWAGWLSATIARVGYPPPRKLTEAGHRRLENVSIVLVLLGFVNFFRLLITGRRRRDRLRTEPADALID